MRAVPSLAFRPPRRVPRAACALAFACGAAFAQEPGESPGQALPELRVAADARAIAVESSIARPCLAALTARIGHSAFAAAGLELLAPEAIALADAPVGHAKWSFPVALAAVQGFDLRFQTLALPLDTMQLGASPIVSLDASLAEPRVPPSDDVLGELARVAVRFERTNSDPPGLRVVAEYVARTSDHGLRTAAVLRHHDVIDVHFALKVPGPGEGKKDIVEILTAVAELGADYPLAIRAFGTVSVLPQGAALEKALQLR